MNTDTHHIEISLNTRRHRVIHQGVTFADTHAALTLTESGYDPVHYFPRTDVNTARLAKSTHTSAGWPVISRSRETFGLAQRSLRSGTTKQKVSGQRQPTRLPVNAECCGPTF